MHKNAGPSGGHERIDMSTIAGFHQLMAKPVNFFRQLGPLLLSRVSSLGFPFQFRFAFFPTVVKVLPIVRMTKHGGGIAKFSGSQTMKQAN